MKSLLSNFPISSKKSSEIDLYNANLSKLNEKDIAIFSYPRSGNTWLRLCLTDVLLQLDGNITSSRLQRQIGEAIPTLTKMDVSGAMTASPDGGRLFKTHRLDEVGGRKFIYLVRDPLDSLRSHYRFAHKGKPGTVEQIDEFCRSEAKAWHSHVAEALRIRENDPGRCIFISYEGMKQNGPHVLKKACDFIGMRPSENMISRALENQSIEKRREIAKVSRHPSALYNYNEGQIGLGRKELPDTTQEFILVETEELWTRACGVADKDCQEDVSE